MDRDFWLERWSSNQIGFHQPKANPLLEEFWPKLGVTHGSAVFVPLCGKSLDMRWLEAQGHPVYGVEYSEEAVLAYFNEGGETCERAHIFYFKEVFRGPKSTIYCGDFFDIHAPDILGVRGVYDRGALVALPEDLRVRYADHLLRIIPEHAHILLITLEYDQTLVDGPPFSVAEEEVQTLYGPRCRIDKLATRTATDLPPKFAEAGVKKARENVYHVVKES